MLTVMVNRRHGGFSYSDEAMAEYHKIKPGVEMHEIERHDEVMVDIVKRMGEKAWGISCKICFETINEVYRDHYRVDGYDGFESVQIEYTRYMIDRIRDIMDNRDFTSEQKVLQIRHVLSSVEYAMRSA